MLGGGDLVAQKDKGDELITFTFDMIDNFTGGTS